MENQQTPEGKTEFTYFPNHGDEEGNNSWTVVYGKEDNEVIITAEDLESDAQEVCKRLNEIVSHNQETNEINVCFSKPYQNLQRELFEKKKEIESFKEANTKLVEANKELIRMIEGSVSENCTNHTPYRGECVTCGNYSNWSVIKEPEELLEKIRALIQTYETK